MKYKQPYDRILKAVVASGEFTCTYAHGDGERIVQNLRRNHKDKVKVTTHKQDNKLTINVKQA